MSVLTNKRSGMGEVAHVVLVSSHVPRPSWTFGFGTSLGFVLGLGGLDLGLWLVNKPEFRTKGF